MKLKLGLKLWSINSNLIVNAKKLIEQNIFQYIELTYIPQTSIAPFQIDVPYIIHITTEKHGLNIGDKRLVDKNFQIIEKCLNVADQLNANYLILHPGFGDIENTMMFLQEIEDKRILVENMPKIGMNNETLIGYSPEHIKRLIGRKFGFCFDLNHAIKASVSLHIPYKKYIKKFLEIQPKMFHISDGKITIEKDEHLHIGDGEYDFSYLLKLVIKSNSNMVTLETPRYNDSLYDDISNVNKLLNILKYLNSNKI